MTARYPNFPDKQSRDSLFRPRQFLDYYASHRGGSEIEVPRSIVICYSSTLVDWIGRQEGVRSLKGPGITIFVAADDGEVGVCGGYGIGAPVAAALVEELVALGASRFITIGSAGTLTSTLSVGDFVVCTKAVRDEGVSHHYATSEEYADSSPGLTSHLETAFRKEGLQFETGPSWSIDAPYRETLDEVRHYRDRGVLTVDMEASAVFTVARVLGAEAAAAFVISDSLANDEWDPHFFDDSVSEGLRRLYTVACSALAE